MKLYKAYKNASIKMGDDPKFKEALQKLFTEENIQYLIESGTYLGTGSTRMIIEAFPKDKKPICFYTYEINYRFYKQATTNLSAYEFVTPIWGLSVTPEDAIAFVKQDEVIANHTQYPDVFIDDIENPVDFYLKECEGKLVSKKQAVKNFFFPAKPEKDEKPQYNLLNSLLEKHQKDKPLVILDSAGGTGYLEFKTLMKNMEHEDFFLLLDDIHHLKHFRSFAEVQNNPKFELLGHSLEIGWALAKYTA